MRVEVAKYEDELARARAAAEHEAARERNVETVRMNEAVTQRAEALRRATEEAAQAARRQTETMKAELERETLRAKALAEAEGRAAEARATEDVSRRLQAARLEGEAAKAVAVVVAAADRAGAGLRALLGDPQRLTAGAAALALAAAGFFGAREGARVAARQVERVLGTPQLLRETSRPAGVLARAARLARPLPPPVVGEALLRDVVLPVPLRCSLVRTAGALAATRAHGAPFRNLLLYGPPGTGKTLVAKRLARAGGLEYALLSGGDVAPLGAAAVTQLHALFDWAATTRTGMLLFVDEADAFLGRRVGGAGSGEGTRAALNALLFRTSAPSPDVSLVLATNRPEDLDEAVLDRMDDALCVPLPGLQERSLLAALYFNRYVRGEGAAVAYSDGDARPRGWVRRFLGRTTRSPPPIATAADVTPELLVEVAHATAGFSGRELAKLMASVAAAVYGAPPPRVLHAHTIRDVVRDKVQEHAFKASLSTAERSFAAVDGVLRP